MKQRRKLEQGQSMIDEDIIKYDRRKCAGLSYLFVIILLSQAPEFPLIFLLLIFLIIYLSVASKQTF